MNNPSASFRWVVVSLIVLGIVGPAIALLRVYRARRPIIGDGKNVETYGFDLSNLLVERSLLAAGDMPRDALPALNDPKAVTPGEIDKLNAAALHTGRMNRGAFLLDSDLVVGVQIQGETRAYPIRILNWHEIVNDTLSGVPIAVTYSGLCDSVGVFDRRPARADGARGTVAISPSRNGGSPLRFGHSGLLFNSNLVMYDVEGSALTRGSAGASPSLGERGPKASLWSQVQARAICGPAAAEGTRLKVLPAAVVSYGKWRVEHPETTVLRGDPDYGLERYNTVPYESYYLEGRVKFPVWTGPATGQRRGWATMARVMAVRTTGNWKVLAMEDIAQQAGGDGLWHTQVDEVPVTIAFDRASQTVAATMARGNEALSVIYARWFAWNAMYDAAGVWRPRPRNTDLPEHP
jgi:hypothetical protein